MAPKVMPGEQQHGTGHKGHADVTRMSCGNKAAVAKNQCCVATKKAVATQPHGHVATHCNKTRRSRCPWKGPGNRVAINVARP